MTDEDKALDETFLSDNGLPSVMLHVDDFLDGVEGLMLLLLCDGPIGVEFKAAGVGRWC